MSEIVPTAAMPITAAPSTPDEQLKAIQDMRFGLLAFLTQQGQPQDTKEQMVYLTALNDATRHALGVKRIESDENTAKGNQDAAMAIVAAVVGQASQIKHAELTPVEREVPMLTEADGGVYVIEGELAIGTPTLTFEQFVAQTIDAANAAG